MKVEILKAQVDEPLAASARSLIKRLYAAHHSYYGLSTTSCQVYDTAWVAMITKTTKGTMNWLFPESFYYLLKTQSDDGSWGTHPATKTAGILDTAAALLALLKHLKQPLQIYDVSSTEVRRRIESASNSLRHQLATWDDVSETNHIGVEMIVPSLLAYLEKEDARLAFEFPCKQTLDLMNETKLSRFRPESLYGHKPSSAIHSLEAFLGKIDFDRISHHLFNGSMLASPSSTAAYLIEASHWDDEAEKYLRHIAEAGTGHGDGGIPGTFPTTHFEISWTIATLLQSGFGKSDLECAELQGLADILVKAFQDEHGIIGFAPQAPDVDDTAKALLALSMLNQPVSPDPMIKAFETPNHFATFGSERDPSFTSNCHVLLALLHQSDINHYYSQIVKTAEFICEFWWKSDHHVKDKWHLSHLYPTMLLIEAFVELLRVLDKGMLPDIAGQKLHRKVAISLFQACYRTLLSQQDDGSWNGMPEQTSYAMLSLMEAHKCCFFDDMRSQLQLAIERGVQFLKSRSFRSTDQNWTSKTAYQVSFVAEAYELAALKVFESKKPSGTVGRCLDSGTGATKLGGFAQLISKTPLFSGLPEWQLRASLLESSLFVPLLRADRLNVYSRDEIQVSEDKYLDIIPFTWVGCNNRQGTFVSTSFIYEMMLLSLFGYQTDEFFEAVAVPAFPKTAGLHELIDTIINDFGKYSVSHATHVNGSNGFKAVNGHRGNAIPSSTQDISTTLAHFVAHVLTHKSVLAASTWDRENLRRELKAFLHAHTTQGEENARFASQTSGNSDIFSSSTRSFFQWVRTTGADHVACAYSFAFACCLMSSSLSSGKEVFPTVVQKYLSAAATRHLTTTCRMYNDFGSVARDTTECNVNSVHFPEFGKGPSASNATLEVKKDSLAKIAEYEHSCLTETLKLLQHEILHSQDGAENHRVGYRKTRIIQFYCDVTALYNQLYVLKDLSSSMK